MPKKTTKNKKAKAANRKASPRSRANKKEWLYSQTVREHFLNPKNVLWDKKDYKADAKGVSGNPVCGDVMTVWIKVDPKTKKIKECKWKTYGCASAIAATSMMSVIVTEKGGMALKKAVDLKPQEIVKRLNGLPNQKFHCAILGKTTLKEAINDYLRKQKRKK
jgi:NifU-like protein involved in Fe-S cluster formation